MLEIQGWIVIGLIALGCFFIWRCLGLLDHQNVLLSLLENSTRMKLDNLTSRVLDTEYQLKQIRIEIRRSQGLDSGDINR
tara:strand:- start:2047 stop:2286 length:240 start_codon:yes stop_codon:yes gene_type:complete